MINEYSEYDEYNNSNVFNNDYKDLARSYIEDLEEILQNPETTIINKTETTNANYKSNKDIELKPTISADDILLTAMLNSNDETTYYISLVMSFIREKHPELYEKYYDVLIEKVDYHNRNAKFIGNKMDTYKYHSTGIVLESLLSGDENARYIGERLLDAVLNGDDDYSKEFGALFYYLMDKTTIKFNNKLKDTLIIMKELYDKGNKAYVIDNMRKLTILISRGLRIREERCSGWYNPDTHEIALDNVCSNSESITHELGHAFYEEFSTWDKEQKPEQLFKKAQMHLRLSIIKNRKLISINKQLRKKAIELIEEFNKQMIEKYGSRKNALKAIEEYIQKMIDNNKVRELLDEYNVSPKISVKVWKNLRSGKINIKRLAKQLYRLAERNFVERVLLTMDEGCLLDIISAIFGGTYVSLIYTSMALETGHSSSYYAKDKDLALNEIMANLNTLLTHNSVELLNLLRDLVGQEFFDFIMAIHNEGMLFDEPQQELQRSLTS